MQGIPPLSSVFQIVNLKLVYTGMMAVGAVDFAVYIDKREDMICENI